MDTAVISSFKPLAPSADEQNPASSATRKLSCGVVVLNRQAEILLCHVTGQGHWDLPKGGAHAGESPLAAALRETQEETGLLLNAADLLDLGRLPYRARKDLHLFAVLMPRLDVTQLHCDSHYTHPLSRQRLPEMDDYGWFTFDRIPALCSGKLATVLCERLHLPALLQQLVQQLEQQPVQQLSTAAVAPAPVPAAPATPRLAA